MPELSRIKKPLHELDKDDLIALALSVGVERREDDPVAEDEPVPIGDVLIELPPSAIVARIVESLSDDELTRLLGVKGRKDVRHHRADLEAAARGEVIEAEREEAARAQAEQENALARRKP